MNSEILKFVSDNNNIIDVILQCSRNNTLSSVKSNVVGTFVGDLLTLLQKYVKDLPLSSLFYDNYSILQYERDNTITRNFFNNSVKAMVGNFWDENELRRLRSNQSNFVKQCIALDEYTSYNIDHVKDTIITTSNNNKNLVTVTMTTCKRFDLFYKTMNSFLECVVDKHLIKEFIVIDDNSSIEDITRMKMLYPFIRFIIKDKKDKGHARSMNILKNEIKTPYFFHLEDDWLFIRKENYITNLLSIMDENEKYGQVLLNLNYGEREETHEIIGGILKYKNDIRYYIHQYFNDQNELIHFMNQNQGKTCAYWPHYSLRVGLTRKNVLDTIGEYNENAGHFEKEYAERYVKHGFLTTFLDNVYCLHIGRCTWERNDVNKKNAYDLNKESQFIKECNEVICNQNRIQQSIENEVICNNSKDQNGDSAIQLSIVESSKEEVNRLKKETEYKYCLDVQVINLKKRTQRLKNFIDTNGEQLKHLNYHVYDGIDGSTLTPTNNVLKLFENCDFNYRKGIVGCAYSHIILWYSLYNTENLDTMLIFEDDAVITENFLQKFDKSLSQLPSDWDVLFLGHFLYPQYRTENDFSTDMDVKVEKWSKEDSMKKSMGGNFGYAIRKSGVKKIIQKFITEGIVNAIDWELFKCSDMNTYYIYPHIVKSKCVQGKDPKDEIPSDIQYDYTSLNLDTHNWMLKEIQYWVIKLNVKGINYMDNYVVLLNDSLGKDIPDDHNSNLYYSNKLLSRDQILSGVCVIGKQSRETISKFLETNKEFPFTFYTLRDSVLITIPKTKIDSDVIKTIPLGGSYFNIYNPLP